MADSSIKMCDGLTGSPGNTPKEGQEDKGSSKQLRGDPLTILCYFALPWSSWPSFWLFPGLPVSPSHILMLESGVMKNKRKRRPITRLPQGITRHRKAVTAGSGSVDENARKAMNRCNIAKLILRWFEGVAGSSGKSQEEGQEAQEKMKWPGGTLLAILGSMCLLASLLALL